MAHVLDDFLKKKIIKKNGNKFIKHIDQPDFKVGACSNRGVGPSCFLKFLN